ncbi:carbohydrate ABC transporter permease [Sinorhizobium numidicum]|uniref:Carbohydrate ABC transporter permease n=1 Tax=Sinorhizobium numidicum TaxID=680248 RepID=A0ABY8CUF7_9HYPH|nr:carbohydrate ABC transporter permease [Sinorhizobium numidicum]WEX74366.1 carbohydrate ABC transporter permease [Sinorhizobium numidicum]WEX80353.1 carbohydrate ABC transporter permease [Sinorhizobium numidicum]
MSVNVSQLQYSEQRLPAKALRRRQLAVGVWLYLALIAIGTVMTGTFILAFVASLKVDPLERPFRLGFDQVNPAAWFAAAGLGEQGAGAPWWGGFAPGARVTFNATYAAPTNVTIEEPKAEIPRRRPGSGIAAALTRDYAADYASIMLKDVRSGTMSVRDDDGGRTEVWQTRTFTYEIAYDPDRRDGPTIERTPLNLTAPRSQSLVDSTLSPSRTERRGRLLSWDNITPGALGLIFNNYRRVINETADLQTGKSLFGNWLVNSFVIAVGRVVLTLIVASLAGYALARLKLIGARFFFAAMLFSMTIPAQVTFVSNYLIFRDLSLLNTPWSVIVVVVVSAHVLLMKQFFEGFPKEIEEAAIVDGANRFQVFWRIVLPNAKPALMVNAILAFQGAWNDFFWPFVLITSPPSSLTIQVGLLSLRRSFGGAQADWGLVLAGAFISIVPVVILFVLFQRYIISNQINEGIK